VLDEVFAVRDEYFFDGIGMTDEIDAAMSEAQLDHIAVVAGAANEEIEPIAAKFRQIAAEPMSLGPVGYALLSHDPHQAAGST
jgi:hypothetical protein